MPAYGEAGTITQVLIAQVSLRTLVPTLLSFADRDRAAVLIADRNGVPLIQTGWPPHLTENGMAGLPPIRGALANRTGTLDKALILTVATPDISPLRAGEELGARLNPRRPS